MFKWEFKLEEVTNAKPESIWKLWTQVSEWPTWDTELEWARLDGPFKAGANGLLKPRGWPASKFALATIDEGKGFETTSQMPLTKMTFSHSIVQEDGKTFMRYHVKVAGMMAPMLYLTMKPMLQKGLAAGLKRLSERAATE